MENSFLKYNRLAFSTLLCLTIFLNSFAQKEVLNNKYKKVTQSNLINSDTINNASQKVDLYYSIAQDIVELNEVYFENKNNIYELDFIVSTKINIAAINSIQLKDVTNQPGNDPEKTTYRLKFNLKALPKTTRHIYNKEKIIVYPFKEIVFYITNTNKKAKLFIAELKKLNPTIK